MYAIHKLRISLFIEFIAKITFIKKIHECF